MRSSFKIYSCLLLLCLTFLAKAQKDTIPIVALELTEADLVKQQSLFNQQKVVSGSRSLQNVDDLPLTIYVITKEEIRQYGYVTLVDVLKHLPGIRVSQPGSALEGETFQMRGLRGNSYTKILINNIPIKPVVAHAMPLGAQLPIQQAERIEVIYGPAVAVYGTDASAGVINIILEKKERPTFTQARLNAGGVGGYTDLNLLFGGTLGRNKQILNFSVYGSTTILEDRPTVYNDDLYNPFNYMRLGTVDSSYVFLQNYRGENAQEARFSTLPHLSRMFGADLYYRNWRLNFQRMYRRDHSATGLNPLAIGYDNPLNYFGEDITNVNLGFSKRKKKFGVELNFSYLRYKVDNRSSSQWIRNSLNQGLNLIALGNTLEASEMGDFNFELYDSLRAEIYDYYFSGNRFSYAESLEIGIEQVYSYAVTSWLEFSLGFNYRGAFGTPLVTLVRRPIGLSDEFPTSDSPIPAHFYSGEGISAFIQSYIARPRWNMTLGLQYYNNYSSIGTIALPSQKGINPRLAVLYKITPKLSLRSFYGTAFRVPSPYYYVNTFELASETSEPLKIARLPLQTEKTTAFELGLRWNPTPKIRLDAVSFYNYTNNVISYNFNTNVQDLDDINSVVGYFNNANDVISVSGVQATIDYRNIISRIGLDVRLNMQYANSLQTRNQNQTFSFAPEVPTWSASGIVSVRPLPKWSVSLLNVFQGAATVNRQDDFENGYYVLDGVLGYDLSDKFQGTFKINNVFNAQYGGLLATSSPDDLYFNPQPLLTWQIGLSYRTN